MEETKTDKIAVLKDKIAENKVELERLRANIASERTSIRLIKEEIKDLNWQIRKIRDGR